MILLFLALEFLHAKVNCDKALDAVPVYGPKAFSELHKFYKEYSSCMDGGIAYGAQTTTVEALDKNWSQLKDLKILMDKDRGFRKFIVDNIAPVVTGQEQEVGSIIEKAKKSCPKNQKQFCKELVTKSEKALQEESF